MGSMIWLWNSTLRPASLEYKDFINDNIVKGAQSS